ncbi:response regulator [Roseivirga sp.]|uniref:response regulator n=1 Tax=Roseivirga sp. TaxID=1964215 RepID=UPI002B277D76|nr:response regulator [Roseivirga sp.]
MKKSILILEDEAVTRLLLSYYLSEDYDLSIYENGLEGLAWLENGYKADLIITDLEMPTMDGFEFVKQVRNDGRFRYTQILVTSSLDEKEAKEKITCHCTYLHKSAQFSSLQSCVSRMLNEAQT